MQRHRTWKNATPVLRSRNRSVSLRGVEDPLFLFDYRNGGISDGRISVDGPSSPKNFTRHQLLVSSGNSTSERLEYDYDTNEFLGIKIEPAQTNLVLQSNFASGWTTLLATISGSVTDPFGTTTARTLKATATAGYISQTVVATSSQTRTFSVWIKRRTGSGTIQIQTFTGNVVTCAVTSDWKRFSVTRVGSGSGNFTYALRVIVQTANDEVDIWGAQFEVALGKTVPTSNVTTLASSVTTVADNIVIDCSSVDVEPIASTFFVEVDVKQINVNTPSPGGWISLTGSRPDFASLDLVTDGSAVYLTPADETYNGYSPSGFDLGSGVNRVAVSLTGSGWSIAMRKSTGTVTSASQSYSVGVPSDGPYIFDTCNVGASSGNALYGWSGYLKCAAYFPYAMTQNELAALVRGGMP